MILRCYPTISAIHFGDIPNLVSCAFSTIPIFPLFNSQNFLFTCKHSNHLATGNKYITRGSCTNAITGVEDQHSEESLGDETNACWECVGEEATQHSVFNTSPMRVHSTTHIVEYLNVYHTQEKQLKNNQFNQCINQGIMYMQVIQYPLCKNYATYVHIISSSLHETLMGP